MTKYFYNPVITNDHLLDNFNKFLTNWGSGAGHNSEISNFSPTVNTREGEYAYHIEIDLPGIKKDEINISSNNGVLTVSGEREFKHELKKDDYYKVECAYGKFQRGFSLPKDVDPENIEASYADGVLEIIIPKLAKAETKKISIK
jgi:HSP20 family protein